MSPKGSAYVSVTLVLPPHQWEWLQDMAAEHKLSSASKALRCCVTCVALGDLKEERVRDRSDREEEEGSSAAAAAAATRSVELSEEQAIWMETERENDATGVVRACMEADEYTVFGVIRCKKSISQCQGAQGAVDTIKEKYCKKDGEVETKENVDITKGCGCAGET